MASLQITSCLELHPPGGRTLMDETNVMLLVFIGRMNVLFILLKNNAHSDCFHSKSSQSSENFLHPLSLGELTELTSC